MEKKFFRILGILALFVVLIGSFTAVMPAYAAANELPQQETPQPPGDTGGDLQPTVVVTNIVPETGGNDGDVEGEGIGAYWLVLVIVGVALLALLIGLLARGSGTRID